MMIVEQKRAQALFALNGLLVQLRYWALRDEKLENFVTVLDIAEELPRLIAQEADRTKDFENALKDLSTRFPELGLALERFSAQTVPEIW